MSSELVHCIRPYNLFCSKCNKANPGKQNKNPKSDLSHEQCKLRIFDILRIRLTITVGHY